jgi:hypothetical protein
MNIKTPVIGIPEYWWHKKAIKYARKYPSLIEMDIKNLCYECHRHRNILLIFDAEQSDFKSTLYWQYYNGKKSEKTIRDKINKYKKLYYKLKNGYDPIDETGSSIIITDDGCRLDGSHRLAVLSHLGYSRILINVFLYEKVFTTKECKKIREENKRYRENEYPDINRQA